MQPICWFDTKQTGIAPPVGREVLVDAQSSGLCHIDLWFAYHDFLPMPGCGSSLLPSERQNVCMEKRDGRYDEPRRY
jgi:hypothetical protein